MSAAIFVLSVLGYRSRVHSIRLQARAIIKDIAMVTATERDTATAVGADMAGINRMAGAFEA